MWWDDSKEMINVLNLPEDKRHYQEAKVSVAQDSDSIIVELSLGMLYNLQGPLQALLTTPICQNQYRIQKTILFLSSDPLGAEQLSHHSLDYHDYYDLSIMTFQQRFPNKNPA